MRTRHEIAQDCIDGGFTHTGMAMRQIAGEVDAIHREEMRLERGEFNRQRARELSEESCLEMSKEDAAA